MNIGLLTKFFDKLGICISGLCLIHCLIMPFILLAFPMLSHYFHDIEEDIHLIFGAIVLLSAFFAIYPHCKKSGRKDILILAILGSGLTLLAFTFLHDLNEKLETVVTSLGSIMLIVAHLKNIKLKHSSCEDITSPCSHHH